ncbi:TRAP transporter substrate-binding protein [Propylenella binzhouense]|uniref:TRAP transporter substrate-binding protein n=1 Tax=Propylenella binzhouense TaxID=2555902 RepID=A0A964T1D6_9HYPH|nr:TRAP transporter substrate-binding protein [Propylenella binzhouense]MYZ46530.1 TRAP transporter substrate-binding protein [Propylenella binzhouense]
MSRRAFGAGALCAAAFSIATMVATPAAAADAVMKIGTPTINDNQHEWMKLFEQKVEARLGDRLDVQIYPASQLGPIPRMIEGLQYGTVEGFAAPPFFFTGLNKKMSVLSASGLFSSMDNCWETAEDEKFRSIVFSAMEENNIMGLSAYCSAPQAILTKKKINSLDDLAGLKIRVLASNFEIDPFKAVGMNPVPMPLNDVVPALERGVIDSVSSAMTVFQGFKMTSVAPHVTMTKLFYFVGFVEVSKSWFDSLPKDVQQVLREEAKAVEADLRSWNADMLERIDGEWKAAGGTISSLPAADEAEFEKRTAEATKSVLAGDPKLKAFYDSLEAVAASHR